MPVWPDPSKTFGHSVSIEFPDRRHFTYAVATQCCDSLGRRLLEVAPHSLRPSLHVPFPFADFVLCICAVISHSCKSNYPLSSMSPSKSQKLRVVQGIPDPPSIGSGSHNRY